MATRRRFLQSGLQAFALGLLGSRALARTLRDSVEQPGRDPDRGESSSARRAGWPSSRPFLEVARRPPSVLVHGLPFAQGFSGDTWDYATIPFHRTENDFPGGSPPPVTESVDVAIVGGGLSGLATAYMLRHRHPVLFELRPRFGGVSAGETWEKVHYSLGGAYFIAPDEGSSLEDLYRELSLDRVYRLSPGGEDPVELGGVIRRDFWTGAGLGADERLAFRRYAEIVRYFAEDSYPDIPLDESQDNAWILELDRRSLREDLETRMGMPIPPLLAAGIQAYCYSSFGTGWDWISAASGWNFLAAEEYGRWVCPGGNAWVADVLWKRLVRAYRSAGGDALLGRLRANQRVVDVRPIPGNRVQVTYKDESGTYRSLAARKVVMACSKHIAKHLLPGLEANDPDKFEAMSSVTTCSYLVANVLLESPIEAEFYDVFLMGDGSFPMDEAQAAARVPVVDLLDGAFTRPASSRRNVLTLYWPLPWPSARLSLLELEPAWQEYANRLAPQVEAMLALLDVPRRAVRQVRMSRWGHAMPIASPEFIASGLAQHVRRPYLENVYFVNQDNWALPAFETCLLEAQTWAAAIDVSL